MFTCACVWRYVVCMCVERYVVCMCVEMCGVHVCKEICVVCMCSCFIFCPVHTYISRTMETTGLGMLPCSSAEPEETSLQFPSPPHYLPPLLNTVQWTV